MENYSKHLEIRQFDAPNPGHQGIADFHTSNPHHDLLIANGWVYSHTTPIGTLGGTKFAHHTYKLPGTDWSIGVDCRPGWATHSSKAGSGHKHTMFKHGLRKYLPRKTRELLRQLNK